MVFIVKVTTHEQSFTYAQIGTHSVDVTADAIALFGIDNIRKITVRAR
ncbi:hypothetical protein [Burkholderia gladioli]|nr:hypothetical protein [Burkholderia gladioli]